jgi:putative sugar O-methyltransferase
MDALDRAPPLFRPSIFWREIAAENIRMIKRGGIGNFKRSLSQNYFNWPVEGPDHPQMRMLLAAWSADPNRMPLAAELMGAARLSSLNRTRFLKSKRSARHYTHFVGLLWWYATREDPEALAQRLEEPIVGNPVPIEIHGRRISQDLANSLREYRRVQSSLIPTPEEARPVLAEIGAGYGRFGYVALSAQPCRYWIFDIAPALSVAEWYLAHALANRRIFRWRPFSAWREVEAEIADADIAIFSIDQLPLIPDASVRAFATISVIHEMRPEQIEAFMSLMSRKANTAIYTKNHTSWFNERDGFLFESARLLPPAGWQTSLDRPDDVLPIFTEKLSVRG